MAPTITGVTTSSQEHLTLSHKLRKPLVEKFRRERINSCIEQLKSLLGPEFLQQHPDSKLEKADILEMTVGVLRRLQQQQQRGLMKNFHKLQSSSDHKLTEADFSPLSSTLQTSITTDQSPVNSVLWRPWWTPTDWSHGLTKSHDHIGGR
ncbi:transcription factor HES-5-like [Antennarius striatus]|uniref:transcription factor HES-5-like n=1 Tax=Antennarius striatus TaxID=241820 RepID=UPI0035B0BCDF